ncbi:SDR family NAD(P)-dependent oxidoreductase [Pedobacter frigidisoli]|uniref:SDR family NAD(P)-dependent oxidoreductase n=1 Tax=Pedobacter frigidisoli TaxID=2530455 RepID=A0A4R0P302_9SPHI|nr:NAD(P)-binding domain-containing protein [Pedobacter frigidisoli]TCD11215.1 SDR family NAD(P)-dependent oxidoreductase [Pedobacter frigidisoli]
MMKDIKTVSILGCGWFGLPFAKKLIQLGYQVKGSTTTPTKLATLAEENISPFLINFTTERISADPVFFETDVLFICIPPKRNSTELNSYPDKIKSILAAAKDKTKKVVLVSSTSVYSDENLIVNEESDTNPDTDSGKVVLAAELLVKEYRSTDYAIIRFAGLIGPNRNPGRFFAGKTDVPNGLAPVNLIHQTDAIGIACKLLEKQAFGKIYNACAPNHPTKMEFYSAAAKESGLIEPTFITEKKDWKIVESLNVPKYLNYDYVESI